MNVQQTFDAIAAIANQPVCSRSVEGENVWMDSPMVRECSVQRTITLRKENESCIVYEEKTEIKPDYEDGSIVNTKIIVLAFAVNGSATVTDESTGSITVYEKIYNNIIEEIFSDTALFRNHSRLD